MTITLRFLCVGCGLTGSASTTTRRSAATCTRCSVPLLYDRRTIRTQMRPDGVSDTSPSFSSMTPSAMATDRPTPKP
ncbi:hypothetical protein [Streptomyces rhizosphaerihabitans]|uniref:hypothetical protein n=1 Tax=Streptomyces rhizosphaerihabitans TaxID=1266770 RepID=UPI0021C092A4|nr:hypothetical protein [Streptomyces rhizosphaerihabitans]MCT9010544.1 hypothetical protein [Streptomyces rhizosphaerihabitans]